MKSLSEAQIAKLTSLFRFGATEASHALSLWIDQKASVSVDRLEQLCVNEATDSLGPAEATICGCMMSMAGRIQGTILFCFDDASGLLLCDWLLKRDVASDAWNELETSCVMETSNIVACAYLNSLASEFGRNTDENKTSQTEQNVWVPTPPQFVRDYAASILEFAVMSQAAEFDTILVARTTFQIAERPMTWSLLLIPDAPSLEAIKKVLG